MSQPSNASPVIPSLSLPSLAPQSAVSEPVTPRTPRPPRRRWHLWAALLFTLTLLAVRFEPVSQTSSNTILQHGLQVAAEVIHRMVAVIFVPCDALLSGAPPGMADPVGLALTAALKHNPGVCDALQGVFGPPVISNSLQHRCVLLASHDTETLSAGFSLVWPTQLLWVVVVFLMIQLDG